MEKLSAQKNRVKDDLFLNIKDELEVFILSKSTQSYRLTLQLLFQARFVWICQLNAKCELQENLVVIFQINS